MRARARIRKKQIPVEGMIMTTDLNQGIPRRRLLPHEYRPTRDVDPRPARGGRIVCCRVRQSVAGARRPVA